MDAWFSDGALPLLYYPELDDTRRSIRTHVVSRYTKNYSGCGTVRSDLCCQFEHTPLFHAPASLPLQGYYENAFEKGNPMNDLITILIILAALISFLKKLFGERKRAGAEEQEQPMKPPFEWKLPWELEEDESQKETIDQSWMNQGTTPVTKQQQFASEKKANVVQTSPLDDIASSQPFELQTEKSGERQPEAVLLDIISEKRLQEGIVLAEILGPCRGKQRFH
ncbi:MAG: hypothetical protein ACOY90_22190 [Candidatus Zhuqueibacterota bacterium]